VAVENARLFTERGRIAELLQASLLPPRLPEVPGWATATRFRPAGDLNRVGGDFYDAAPTDGGMLVCVGDIAGKGPAAAALTGQVRHALTTAFVLCEDLSQAIGHVNRRLLATTTQPGLCTLAAAELTAGGEARIALAGHPPPVVVRGGEAEYVGAGGILLGAVEDADWPVTSVRLEPGDLLVLYTDGVTDAVGAHGRFGAGRLVEAVRGATTAGEVVDAIDAGLRDYEVGPQTDDIAVLAVQRVAP
jgi:serine phosphatase RsbU (regulator of sigma subunit)